MSYTCDVTTEREGDFTSFGIYMLLRFVEVVSRGHAMSPLLNAKVIYFARHMLLRLVWQRLSGNHVNR